MDKVLYVMLILISDGIKNRGNVVLERFDYFSQCESVRSKIQEISNGSVNAECLNVYQGKLEETK